MSQIETKSTDISKMTKFNEEGNSQHWLLELEENERYEGYWLPPKKPRKMNESSKENRVTPTIGKFKNSYRE